MAALTVQNIVNAGTKPTFSAASTSDTATIGSGYDTFVVYKNAAGSPVTLTVVVPGTTPVGDTPAQHVLTLPATTGELWIPLRKYYDDGTGNATITLSSATSVTSALVRMG